MDVFSGAGGNCNMFSVWKDCLVMINNVILGGICICILGVLKNY